ncbi:hypothetical protein HP459_20360 [Enterobacter sp. CM29]|uniref:hypothetical protein n=1 Tax=Enterobacter sp. CM29 TaxID=2738449 RepID=UPI0015C540D7|nr:hypothetical protein [Enterobacter sp. CM29]NQD63731.1 hypothetical protein [Enterobacter sp. CM29]
MQHSIDLPNLAQQRMIVLTTEAEKGCQTLKNNLTAPTFGSVENLDLTEFSRKHLMRENEGWEPPAAALVVAWFEQFQQTFSEYATEDKLAAQLGLRGKNAGRRIRDFKTGSTPVPYGVWRRFLVMTGRASQEIIPVLGIFDMPD